MKKNLHILHLDDEPFELENLARALKASEGTPTFQVESCSSLDKYLVRLQGKSIPDIVILDIHLDSSVAGSASPVEETKRVWPDVVILMCSAMDDVATIAESLNRGADDFISKKSDREELALRIRNSYKLALLKKGTLSLADREESPSKSKLTYVGKTLERIAQRVPLMIHSAISAVHVNGESGTGKEMVADLFAYHLGNSGPFIKVNCGAISPTLLESELFGHVKGAFTGAVTDKKGFLESASGGWIFLDEVACLSSSAQVALLRVLENQELLRVGTSQAKSIHVRVISATNEPLPKLVAEGKFRKDLWQRLCETEIDLLPLRERPNEIEPLVRHFCEHMPGGPYQITAPTLDVLCSLPWESGNIRELRNCLRAMTELHVNKNLTPLSIPERIWKKMDKPEEIESATSFSPPSPFADQVVISWGQNDPLLFDQLSDKLLLEVTKKLAQKRGKLSLRTLSKEIGMARSTLSGRLRNLVQQKMVGYDELSSLVGVGSKSDGQDFAN